MRFSNKKVLVTGAASGIGLGIAQRFMSEGATVIATDLNPEALNAMQLDGPGALHTRVSDAGSPSAIAELASWIEAEFGSLDVLVNNAGYTIAKNPEEVVEEEYHAQMNVMLTGPVFYVKHLASLLRKSPNGSVVNISSASAVVTAPGYCPYALAKAAIVKFSEDSAVQVPGVRHNAVMPGFIETPILKKVYGEDAPAQMSAMLAALEPVGRLGTPEDVANCVAFLASDEASYINGTSLVVDGGLSRLNTAVSLASGSVSLVA
jgi:NAD(P)-dependent dehydrogenase (short-subunit alcohol dehydrogenase family)